MLSVCEKIAIFADNNDIKGGSRGCDRGCPSFALSIALMA